MALVARPFDPVDYLDSTETMAFYLRDAIESGNAAEIADAVEVIARARLKGDSTSDASSTKNSRTDVETIGFRLPALLEVLETLGLKLTVKPAAA